MVGFNSERHCGDARCSLRVDSLVRLDSLPGLVPHCEGQRMRPDAQSPVSFSRLDRRSVQAQGFKIPLRYLHLGQRLPSCDRNAKYEKNDNA